MEPNCERVCNLADTQAIERPCCCENNDHKQELEPYGLIPGGHHVEVQGRTLLVPNAVIVASDHVKPIRSWAKIRIKSLPPGSRFLPVRIAALQHVPKADLLGNGKTQRGIVNLHIARAGRETNVALQRIAFAVGYDLFHVNRRRYQIPNQVSGINHLRHCGISKPQAAIQSSYGLALEGSVKSKL